MKAPSERHLQDYIWNNPESLIEPEHVGWLEPIEIFGYEYELPRGRVDLLGHGSLNFYYGIQAIEIKKDGLNLKHLAQVLRYVNDIQRIWHFALAGIPSPADRFNAINETSDVRGVLVGYSCDEDLLIAAQAANVDVYTYIYDGSVGYALTLHAPKHVKETAYLRYYDSDLGDRIRVVNQDTLDTFTHDAGIDWSGVARSPEINILWEIYGGES